MADIDLKSFPFDSMKVLNEQSQELEDDRLYEAQIFRDYFRKFLSNGVYYGNYKNYGENSMQVVLDTGLTIKVKKGCGIIEGVDYENESDRLITLDRPASGSRVDRIVVQMNSSLDTRKTKLIVKQGTGTTPAELTRTDNVYEICIAEVTVSSSSNLTDESIVDKRLDTTLCGIVNSLISVDGEELYEQFQEYVQSAEENIMLKNEDIVDDLVSTDTDKALSAKQGKILKQYLEDLKPKLLFDSTIDSYEKSSSSIQATLRESISNFHKLKVYAKATHSGFHEQISCNEMLCANTSDNSIFVADALHGYFVMGSVDFSNNYVVVTSVRKFGTNGIETTTDVLDIIKIEGYKY